MLHRRKSYQTKARIMEPLRTIGLLLALASSTVLVVSGTGCSRGPQNVADAGRKIDLTLPKPAVRSKTPQTPTGETEAATKKEEGKVEAARASVEGDFSNPNRSKHNGVLMSIGKTQKETRTKAGKQRQTAVISQQASEAAKRGVGNRVDPEKQDARPSKGVPHYSQSDNPLHPSYKKK